MSGIEFYLDAAGEFRWRLKAEGNHEIIGASTEGYHNLSECAANLTRVVQDVVAEAILSDKSLEAHELPSIDQMSGIVREYVMNVAAGGVLDEHRHHANHVHASIPVNAALPSVPMGPSEAGSDSVDSGS